MTIPIFGIGDSWLYKFFAAGHFNIPKTLFDYLELSDCAFVDWESDSGRLLTEMAEEKLIDSVVHRLQKLKNDPKKPRAIVMGGGGNDIVQFYESDVKKTPLYKMLVQKANTVGTALDGGAMTTFVDRELMNCYADTFDASGKQLQHIVGRLLFATDAPILIHAYDHPHPDGRPFPAILPFYPQKGPWLKPIFTARGVGDAISVQVMRIMIDRLNAMVNQVAKNFAVSHPNRVHHVALNGRLAKEADYAVDYKKYWANELHPTDLGFQILAGEFKKKMNSLGIV